MLNPGLAMVDIRALNAIFAATKILVVDDEPRYVRLMEANLISEGYLVIKANNGQEAVEIVADQPTNLKLTTQADFALAEALLRVAP